MESKTVSKPGPPRQTKMLAVGVLRGKRLVVFRALEELELVRGADKSIHLVPASEAHQLRMGIALKHLRRLQGQKEMVA